MTRLFSLLFAAALYFGAASHALAAGFEHIARLTDKGFAVSAQARLLDDDQVLGALAPGLQLSPASVSKLYLAAAALDRWGPQHRFATRLTTSAAIDAEGVLRGDLVLEGGGDPAFASENLWHLIQQLRQHDVTAIDGDLVVSQWRFGPVACITEDRCSARRHSAHAYDAQLSSAGLDYGNWCLNVLPGPHVGDAARIASCNARTAMIDVDSRVTTVASGKNTRLKSERLTRNGLDRLKIEGQIARDSAPRAVYRSSSDPARQTGLTLLTLLEQAGIAVQGDYVVSNTPPPTTSRELAIVHSRPLQALLLRMLNYSNNFMADMLSLGLLDSPGGSLAQAGRRIEAYAETLPGHGPVTLKSGSGLTPDNRVSARDVNMLLKAMYRRAALFPAFLTGLQAPANGPMNFIRQGSDIFQHHVMLKTGTLSEPVTVRAVGGYFRTRSGRWGSFSVLVNGNGHTPYLPWRDVLEALSEDITPMILAH